MGIVFNKTYQRRGNADYNYPDSHVSSCFLKDFFIFYSDEVACPGGGGGGVLAVKSKVVTCSHESKRIKILFFTFANAHYDR